LPASLVEDDQMRLRTRRQLAVNPQNDIATLAAYEAGDVLTSHDCLPDLSQLMIARRRTPHLASHASVTDEVTLIPALS